MLSLNEPHFYQKMITSWYVPNISLEGGIYKVQIEICMDKFCTKIESLTKWPPFFLKKNLKASLKRLPSFYSPHQMTPYFSFVLTERPSFSSLNLSPKTPIILWGSCPHMALPYVNAFPPGLCNAYIISLIISQKGVDIELEHKTSWVGGAVPPLKYSFRLLTAQDKSRPKSPKKRVDLKVRSAWEENPSYSRAVWTLRPQTEFEPGKWQIKLNHRNSCALRRIRGSWMGLSAWTIVYARGRSPRA